MIYTMASGKRVKINDKQIENLMSHLGLTKQEAIQTYLEDEGELENDEQNALDAKAKEVSINRDAGKKAPKKPRKKPQIKISDEKKTLFNYILSSLKENNTISDENIKVVTENKKIEVSFNGKSFSIDLVQHRNPKN